MTKVDVPDKEIKLELEILIRGLNKLEKILIDQRDAAKKLDLQFLAIAIDQPVQVIRAYTHSFQEAINRLGKVDK